MQKTLVDLKRLLIISLSIFSVIAFTGVQKVAALSDGMAASGVLGQADFSGGSPGTSSTQLQKPGNTLLDSAGKRLFVADTNNNRVLVFNLESNGALVDMQADYVLGQADFDSNVVELTQKSIPSPSALAYDEDNKLLFVGSFGDNPLYRVMVFDVAAITNNEDAVNVLGQPDFDTNDENSTQNAAFGAAGLAYDNVNDRLFVADSQNSRVSVFDLSSGITNGMNAANVIGQNDFVSLDGRLDQAGLSSPASVVYDADNNRLFVADQSNARIMVFDLTGGITDGMAASFVLGQANFTENFTGLSNTRMEVIDQIGLDTVHDRLYVADQTNNRVLVWNVASITNDEPAEFVLGQTDFVSNAPATSQEGMSQPESITYNQMTGQIYVADGVNNRVLTFDVEEPDTDLDGTPNNTDTDSDNDGIDNSVEDSFPNNGDTNGDSIPDSQQVNVTAAENPVTAAYTAVESANVTCSVDTLQVFDEAELAQQDPNASYPVGLNNFEMTCLEPGETVDVVVYYDQEYDTSGWSYKKYDDITETYTDITASVTFGTANVGGNTVTTATYSVTDGGPLDQDGTANGTIVDPAGPSINSNETHAPDCSAATPTLSELWPPNRQFIAVGILGVTDADGDTVTINIDSVSQDEEVNTPGATGADAQGLGGSFVELRAERIGGGNGRVYHVSFTADDGTNQTCTGTVKVEVPKNKSQNGAAIDDGPLHDSTIY